MELMCTWCPSDACIDNIMYIEEVFCQAARLQNPSSAYLAPNKCNYEASNDKGDLLKRQKTWNCPNCILFHLFVSRFLSSKCTASQSNQVNVNSTADFNDIKYNQQQAEWTNNKGVTRQIDKPNIMLQQLNSVTDNIFVRARFSHSIVPLSCGTCTCCFCCFLPFTY